MLSLLPLIPVTASVLSTLAHPAVPLDIHQSPTKNSTPTNVAESVAKGTYELKFSAISNSDPLGNVVNPQDDFTAVLNVDGTGINSINADDVNAPIYNVAGQRVSKAQKGIFIQNGKKIAVK